MTSRLFLDRRTWMRAAGLLALGGCTGQPKEERIWIGHIASAGKRAEAAINGMQQTLADLRDEEITIDGRSIGVRHVEAKDKTRARAEASRLLAVNRVVCLIVGPHLEGVADVIAIARAHGAVAVVLDGTADRALADQAIWLGADPETAGEMLARYAIAKGRKVALPSIGEASDAVRGFERAFTKAGGTIGKRAAQWPANAVDPKLAGARGEKGKLCLRVGDPPLFAAEESELWTLVLQPDPASLPEKGRAWADRFEKRFGARPDDDAVLGADAIALIAEGLRAVGSDDRAKLTKNLAGRTEIAGTTGAIKRENGRTRRPMWVERVGNGKIVATEPVPE